MYLKRKVGNDVALRRVTADIRFMEPSVFSRTKKSKNMSVDPGIESKDLPFVETQAYRESYIAAKEKKFKKYSDELNKNGFCIVDLKVDKNLINQANEDIDSAIRENSIKLNSRAYHYNENPRIVEAWKFSKSIKELAVNKTILDILRFSYKSEPIPFSTINFIKGTEQPLHSDELHFGSIPHRYLTGCWIALEDIHPDSGPLSIAVGSHKLPIFSFEQIGLNIPRTEEDFKKNYSAYEEWVKEAINDNDLEVVTPKLRKGQCLIWLSNTLHGAYAIKNQRLTRKSLVVHYHYSACRKLFYPSYSNLKTGKLVPRPSNNIDIRTHTPE